MPEVTTIHATSGPCPYCSSQSFAEVATNHPGKQAVKCHICDRHSTRMPNGKLYPHDDPSSPEGPCAKMVRLAL